MELREQWEEVKELKSLLTLIDKSLLPIKDLDPQETIKFIKEYKAKRFN
jgi:hypothetical protein